MRVLIVGCGYVGVSLGQRLSVAGHVVHGMRRQVTAEEVETLRKSGIECLSADITNPRSLEQWTPHYDWVVNSVSSTRGGADVYQAVYYQGTGNLLDWLKSAPPRKYVHISSTSVYAQQDGSVVDENAPTEPTTETGRWLVKTEQQLLAAAHEGFPAILLRVAGIYGPGRGHLYQQYRRGEARLIDGGCRWINMVHRDDVAAAVEAALMRGIPGSIYNVSDNETVTQREFFGWLSAQMGRPMPPEADGSEAGPRKRAQTQKRVDNRRLREELGWTPRYPTFREGYREILEIDATVDLKK